MIINDGDMSNQNLVTMSMFNFYLDVESWKGLLRVSVRHLYGNVLN